MPAKKFDLDAYLHTHHSKKFNGETYDYWFSTIYEKSIRRTAKSLRNDGWKVRITRCISPTGGHWFLLWRRK
jgi:hypothetical protein